VAVATARRGDLPVYLTGLGTVTADNTVVVRLRVDGELDKVNFVEGQIVHEGDLLAEIDPRPFQVQLKQAQGQLARDEALLKNARLDLARYQEAGEAASQQQRDTAAAAVGQYEGAVLIDQSQIDNANLQLTYCRVTSPLTGKIGLRLVDQGNVVHQTDANGLAVITQLEPIAVIFTLPEDSLPQALKAKEAAGGKPLVAEAYDRDMKTLLATGKLAAVDNQIDVTTGTARFKALFDNTDLVLFPNQFVNVRLLVDTRKGATLIPSSAVQRSPQAMFVYVVREDETAELRPVALGTDNGQVVSVETGLSPGEKVVVDGVDKLVPGAKVAVRPGVASSRPASTRGARASRPGDSGEPAASSRPAAPGRPAASSGPAAPGEAEGGSELEQPARRPNR
jgi:multidrug efflux system membrane fusion protein